MTEQQVRWWTNVIQEEKNQRKHWDNYTTEQLQDTANQHWDLNNFKTPPDRRQQRGQREDPDLQREEEELGRLLEKETTFPPVSRNALRLKITSGKQNKTNEEKTTCYTKQLQLQLAGE